MSSPKKVLLKLTGEIFLSEDRKSLSSLFVTQLAEQIKKIEPTHQFGIVVGGGNFFRGRDHGARLGMTSAVGHQVGMLATMMNGLILKDLFEQHGLATSLFCAIPCPEVGSPISQQALSSALQKKHTLVFTGGTGNPFFTTDTNAVLRALQIDADEIWKGTNVDGIYSADPRKSPDATLLKRITYMQALQQRIGIMDSTAYALAEQHKLTVRVFNIFAPDVIVRAAQDNQFGSVLEV